ncbi:glycosyltransferase family 4 protein [Thiomicrorhabdus sp. zzn3]|uniref:glycosyltransferase family 4 protein n=1 Tax=Thiomicrorhabdus sp. zzn3 TaxID=3039775 RepID=UPI002436DBD0|nr:glycosyltransferase family 4 protein [Thiomicrorhabdus sp. zzn3]MDG6777374.1 glycosyltransferase family 4 protein [Thiomicrorhabdus sp. zzn3]
MDILASQPSYKSVDKSKAFDWKVKDGLGVVYRLPVFKFNNQKVNKALNFFWFPFVAFWFVLFGKKYKVVTVSTSPPVLLAFSVALACKIRGMKLVYHCMDIHPEIGQISGEFKKKWVFNFLKRLDQFTCRVASRIIVLSKDMLQSLLQRDPSLQDKIQIINNYNLGGEQLGEQAFFDPNDGRFRVVFAGNIGRFQNLDFLVKALAQADKVSSVQLVFVGEGAALKQLKSQVKELNLEEQVQFIPHQTIDVAKRIIKDSQVAVVSLQDKVIRYAYPSKTMTYLSLGVPVLALVEEDSELAETLIKHQLGWVCSPENLSKMSDLFLEISQSAHEFDEKTIQSFFDSNLSKESFESKFLCLMKAVI